MAGYLDLAFTTWTDYPGTPSMPGAADLNRLQANFSKLATKPSARLGRTDQQFVASSLNFATMNWNVKVEDTTGLMIPASNGVNSTGTGSYTDRIILPYPGRYLATVVVRSEFAALNNGITQIQLVRVHQDGSTYLMDMDIAEIPKATANPNVCRMTANVVITAAQVAVNAYLRVDYVQSSAGLSTITTMHHSVPGNYAFPFFAVTWQDGGGQ